MLGLALVVGYYMGANQTLSTLPGLLVDHDELSAGRQDAAGQGLLSRRAW